MPVQLNGADLITSSDDYEEGSFTPTLMDTSLDGSGEGQVYSSQIGNYTRIGNVVFYRILMVCSNQGCLTVGDQVHIGGLPFTSAGSSQSTAQSIGFASSLAITAGETVTGTIFPSNSFIRCSMWDVVTGTSSMTITELSVSGRLDISGFYPI